MGNNMSTIFKILPEPLWEQAKAAGTFAGVGIDVADGYIHFSSSEQVEATARLHFANQHGLVLVAFAADAFGAALKWEASRGGQLFPHLYATLDPGLALWAKPLPWDGTKHVFPAGWLI
jgi:uncharacterized protein (DUF952 family)